MPGATKELSNAPTCTAARSLLIVARDHPELFPALQHAFGGSPQLRVIFDRRQADRRQSAQPVPEERRRTERRCLPNLEHDLRCQQYVLVRPHYRRPQD